MILVTGKEAVRAARQAFKERTEFQLFGLGYRVAGMTISTFCGEQCASVDLVLANHPWQGLVDPAILRVTIEPGTEHTSLETFNSIITKGTL